MGRSSLPPAVYFRLLLIGYSEGIDSERGIAWRAADSLALRNFLGLGLLSDAPPDHSTISRTRRLIAVETHRAVFTWVAQCLGSAGLIKGNMVGLAGEWPERPRLCPEPGVTPWTLYHWRERLVGGHARPARRRRKRRSAPPVSLAQVQPATSDGENRQSDVEIFLASGDRVGVTASVSVETRRRVVEILRTQC